MRPLVLTMRAFGSYGRETPIDFTKSNQNLFLITGNTGAGKTTIFDAIVFALYGEASSTSNKKSGMELQSQFTDLHVKPFVELTFSEGNSPEALVYRVRREPKHLRPRKRGVGSKEESEKVSLIMPDGSEYPQKETDKKLEEIVGLTKQQFMQVAMIAQGEFMDLLRASSDNKKVIFRKLFKTELFQMITDELRRRKKEKEKEIATIRTVYQTESAHVVIPKEYERRDELQTLKDKISRPDQLSAVDMTAFLEELELIRNWLKRVRDQKDRERRDAQKLWDEKRDECTRAQSLMRSYEQLDNAIEELKKCQKMEKKIKDIEMRIIQLRDSYEIKDKYDQYEESRKRQLKTDWALRRQEKLLPDLERKAKEAADLEAKEKTLYETELKHFTQISERVENALKFFKDIKEAEWAVSQAQQKENIARSNVSNAREKLEKLERKESEWRKQAEELGAVDGQLKLWDKKNQEITDLRKDLMVLNNQRKEVDNLWKQANQSKDDYLSASQTYDEKHREYESKRRLFLDSQAGFLAKELQPGMPCPVCGSLEHPSPCPQTEEHEELSKEVLEALSQEVNELQKVQEGQANKAQSDWNLANVKEESWTDNMERFRQHLIRNTVEDVADVSDVLTLSQAQEVVTALEQLVNEEGIQLNEKSSILKRVQNLLQGVDQKKETLRGEVEVAQEAMIKATSDLSKSNGQLETLQEEASKDYATDEEALQAKEIAKKKKDRKNETYKAAAKEAQETKTAKEQSEALIEQYRLDLPVQEQETLKQKSSYGMLMEEKQLSESQWKSLVDAYDRDEVNRLQRIVDEYKEKKSIALGMEKTAKATIDDRKRPELKIITQEEEKLKNQYELADGIWNQYQTYWQTDETILLALAPKMEERSRVVEEHTRLDTLYRLVSGNVTGARMDLETYVQRYYLEKILQSANRRFYDMSAGQFELRICQLERAGEGKNKGLDLMVYSNITGKEREIRTLSGGESFMAALSLALGMADQIQESSSSLNLEMMFIDEGFGSLDEHSRNQAVRVLQKMAGGSKLIGIISHVSELKQEIEDQLIVSKDDSGSRVRWS